VPRTRPKLLQHPAASVSNGFFSNSRPPASAGKQGPNLPEPGRGLLSPPYPNKNLSNIQSPESWGPVSPPSRVLYFSTIQGNSAFAFRLGSSVCHVAARPICRYNRSTRLSVIREQTHRATDEAGCASRRGPTESLPPAERFVDIRGVDAPRQSDPVSVSLSDARPFAPTSFLPNVSDTLGPLHGLVKFPCVSYEIGPNQRSRPVGRHDHP